MESRKLQFGRQCIMSGGGLGQIIEKQPLNNLETLLDELLKGLFKLLLSNLWKKIGRFKLKTFHFKLKMKNLELKMLHFKLKTPRFKLEMFHFKL